MLRRSLHICSATGNCTECAEPFPCPAGLARFEAVKRELELVLERQAQGLGSRATIARPKVPRASHLPDHRPRFVMPS